MFFKCVVVFLFYGTLVQAQCSVESEVRVTVTSSRNETGHVTTQVHQDQGISETCPSALPTVEVEARTSSCGDAKSKYHVTVTITTSPAPPLEQPTSTSPPPSTPPPSTSPHIIHRFPGIVCYKHHMTSATWPRAKQLCEEDGGHLLVLRSQREADEVYKLMRKDNGNVIATPDSVYSWVGIRESNTTQNHFVTTSGEPLSATGYEHWFPGQPDSETLGDFVLIYSEHEGLYDTSAIDEFPFFCEYTSC